jgi:uncharacterized protein YndB with AHSA1/START domain
MDEARIEIDAPAVEVYDLIADISNMGRWSPETYRTQWVGQPSHPVPSARFRGWNRATVLGVPATWRTTSIIRQADPGRSFSFDTPFSGARWTYRFESTDDGARCTVVETREEVASPLLVKILYRVVGTIRRQQLADGMVVTLSRLKAAAESDHQPNGGQSIGR